MGESLGGPFSFDIDTYFIDQIVTNSPELLDNGPHSYFTRQFFGQLLANAEPYTASGSDDTSLFLFLVVSYNIQIVIYNLCSTLITTNISFHRLQAKNFLFYKKGDSHLPVALSPPSTLFTKYCHLMPLPHFLFSLPHTNSPTRHNMAVYLTTETISSP